MDVILQSQNAVPQKIWSGWKTCWKLILRHPTVVSFWGSCWQRFLRQTRDKKASLRTLRAEAEFMFPGRQGKISHSSLLSCTSAPHLEPMTGQLDFYLATCRGTRRKPLTPSTPSMWAKETGVVFSAPLNLPRDPSCVDRLGLSDCNRSYQRLLGFHLRPATRLSSVKRKATERFETQLLFGSDSCGPTNPVSKFAWPTSAAEFLTTHADDSWPRLTLDMQLQAKTCQVTAPHRLLSCCEG